MSCQRGLLLCVLVTISSATACRRESAPSQQSETRPTRSIAPTKELAPLIARLDYEARHRPDGELKAERVLDALEQQQLAVAVRRQYLGAALRASYCIGGATHDGLSVAVCEYSSREAALAGKQLMDSRFAAVSESAVREVKDNAVLTIAGYADEAQRARIARALQVFATL